MNHSTGGQRFSRRQFGAAAAGAAAIPAVLAPPSQAQPSTPIPDKLPFDGPIEYAGAAVKPKAEPFPMTQVRITGGPLHDAQDWNRGYMSRLAADRLLYNFRQNAGLDVKGATPLGGWETPADGTRASELRGHFTGHFLSASALLYASAGDQAAKAKADYMVDELAKVQTRLGGGYLSAFPMELFDRLDALSGKPRPVDPATGRADPHAPHLPWAPFYTIHKILAGMIDMYQLAQNRQALAVAQGMADWADRWSASKSEAHMQEILNTEFGGMAEALYNLSVLDGNPQWAKAGDRFTKKRFVNPLALRRDELRGLHVNTHIPQAIAAARRYEISGDTRFHDVADYFWHEVAVARSYVTEGTSNGETWNVEPRRMAVELRTTRGTATAECCCSYNMLKLTRHLFGWTGDPRYFDYYERALFNHRLGTIYPEKGYTQYYLSLVSGTWKTFNTEDGSFWCCTGTGVEEYAKLNDSIYWRDADGLYVNLFIPSELNWEEKGLQLRQETGFPSQQSTALVVTAAPPAPIAFRLRVPSWLRTAPTVTLNGRALGATAAPGGYLSISRVWKAGDRIAMELPMHLTAEAMPDDPSLQAFLYGPLVLAADLGAEGLTENRIFGDSAPRFMPPGQVREDAPGVHHSAVPAIEVPRFRAAAGDVSSWIQPADAPLTFRTAGQAKDVTLAPLNSIFGRRYAVYWEVT
jgi:DUF1680 family protein